MQTPSLLPVTEPSENVSGLFQVSPMLLMLALTSCVPCTLTQTTVWPTSTSMADGIYSKLDASTTTPSTPHGLSCAFNVNAVAPVRRIASRENNFFIVQVLTLNWGYNLPSLSIVQTVCHLLLNKKQILYVSSRIAVLNSTQDLKKP